MSGQQSHQPRGGWSAAKRCERGSLRCSPRYAPRDGARGCPNGALQRPSS
ncbi:MAG: hypothetical protein QXT00_02530 [Ignisphaera sp.]